MLTFDDLVARRTLIRESTDLAALQQRLIERAAPLLERMPPVPQVKALLSRDGGVCPDDGSQLIFDPWSPEAHRCPTCQREWRGDRHHAHWARMQHLWLAERAAHLATLYALTGDQRYATRSREILGGYFTLYFALPNRDNVLGPTHLFFSTYLESIWLLDFLAAAFILRECEQLDEEAIAAIDAIADESATLISEFNEGFSNRQVWHTAARTAIAVWFGDEELAVSAIEGRTGLLGQLGQGFGDDGMWHEGENYHLFAQRGLMIGLGWASIAGTDLREDPVASEHLATVLLAPTRSALPDFTFPARKDSRYGVSLAHPAYVEAWEAGSALLLRDDLAAWLHALYQAPAQDEEAYDSYLHDAGLPVPPRSRSELSWWSLLTMAPVLPPVEAPWQPRSVLLAEQGLAILRSERSYLSIECSGGGDGHGHPDRLHLTLFANGVHWLPDPGTGSYVTRDLHWYRRTLAHNAPAPNGVDQVEGDAARCIAYDVSEQWRWTSATWAGFTRSVVDGAEWTLDQVRSDGSANTFDLPWHLAGDVVCLTAGSWHAIANDDEFVDNVERFEAEDPASALHLRATRDGSTLDVWQLGDGPLYRARGPGLPRRGQPQTFFFRRPEGVARIATVLDRAGVVTGIAVDASSVTLEHAGTTTTIELQPAATTIVRGTERTTLAGARGAPLRGKDFLAAQPAVASGVAVWIDAAPPLDGSFSGFDRSAPLRLDDETQYFRTEEPYPGSDAFAAVAAVNWSDDAVFVAVDVTKPDLVLRGLDAAPMMLDNEADDLNADGVQLHLDTAHGGIQSWLVRPLPGGGTAVRRLEGDAAEPRAAWQRTANGYRLTIGLSVPDIGQHRTTDALHFDLLVNEMRAGRQRRAGQLAWSAGPGWAYLRGDRHPRALWGRLEIAG